MKKNKYGIVYYKETANLGDDIQTYAVYRRLPKVDYLIDREKLSYFVPNKKEKVKVIMNGWYNHDKTHVIPTPYIDPLFISMHFSENDLELKPGYTFLDSFAKDTLNKYEIGCRDKHTLNVLKKMKYNNAYFSSCLTTTIDPIGEKQNKKYIVAVDMNPKIVEHLRKITNLKIIETTHWLFLNDKMTYEEKLNKIDEFDKGNQEKRRKMIEKHINLSFSKRMKLVEKQLKLYQNAELVITDRIHVGLPCLGLKTNVLLIYYDYNGDRVGTFKDFLTNCTEEEFYKMTNTDLTKIKNSNTYMKYREKLISSVDKFINSETQTDKKLSDVDIFNNYIIPREEYIKKLYTEKLEELKEENKKMKEELNNCKNDLAYYNNVKNSRSWKFINKYYNKKISKKNNQN